MKDDVPTTTPTNKRTDLPPDISIQKYRSLKRQLKKLERSNYNSLIFIPCNGNQNWFEIAEHSALFYYYYVVTKLGLKTKFMSDTGSFYDQYQLGYIRTKGFDHIRDNLNKLKLLKTETHKNDIHVFKLNLSFTEAEVEQLIKREQNRRINNLTPVRSTNLDPELHHLLTTVGTRLHHLCSSRLDKLSMHTNGAAVVTLCDGLLENYHKLTQLKDTASSRQEALLLEMRASIYLLMIKIKVLREVGMWDFDLVSSLSEPLDLIRQRIEGNLKKIAKEHDQ